MRMKIATELMIFKLVSIFGCANVLLSVIFVQLKDNEQGAAGASTVEWNFRMADSAALDGDGEWLEPTVDR